MRRKRTKPCPFCGQNILEEEYRHRKSKWNISCDGYYPYCSECGYAPHNGELTRYCPNCGILMIEDIE